MDINQKCTDYILHDTVNILKKQSYISYQLYSPIFFYIFDHTKLSRWELTQLKYIHIHIYRKKYIYVSIYLFIYIYILYIGIICTFKNIYSKSFKYIAKNLSTSI